MNIKTRYTFTMEEYDEESKTCETLCIIERTLSNPDLNDLAQAFLYFLWNSTFSYVESVTVRKDNGAEVRVG
jgi:hypothetical protein